MGILNLTPDSFSDGGKFNNNNKAFKQISNMIKSGANIIDVGGESTRPGSKTIDPKIEWARIKYVLNNFKKKYKKICLSVDTRKSDIMIKSISCGADLINDVSGFNHDPFALIKLKILIFQKFYIICKEHQIQCKRIQNIKMFYWIFMTFLKKKFQILQIIKKS